MIGECWRCEDRDVTLDGHGVCAPCAMYHEQDWDDAMSVGQEIAAYERGGR